MNELCDRLNIKLSKGRYATLAGLVLDKTHAVPEKGYDTVVEELLNPVGKESIDRFELIRYHPWTWRPGTLPGMGAVEWLSADPRDPPVVGPRPVRA